MGLTLQEFSALSSAGFNGAYAKVNQAANKLENAVCTSNKAWDQVHQNFSSPAIKIALSKQADIHLPQLKTLTQDTQNLLATLKTQGNKWSDAQKQLQLTIQDCKNNDFTVENNWSLTDTQSDEYSADSRKNLHDQLTAELNAARNNFDTADKQLAASLHKAMPPRTDSIPPLTTVTEDTPGNSGNSDGRNNGNESKPLNSNNALGNTPGGVSTTAGTNGHIPGMNNGVPYENGNIPTRAHGFPPRAS